MSGIKEVIEQMQEDERKREIYLEHLINRLILVIEFQKIGGTLTEIERTAIIEACEVGGIHKSKYAIKLLEILNK